ncbi:helix-turn-helix transcriptional regulator [Candidatus Woesearchaeota archaeon]|nr:helix-turn-helix transcriptional regulator [Candidatus Woesearchaeota archaeon]
MPKEQFLVVSLREEQAKRLAQVLSNDTSRKILDCLAQQRDATETQLAKELHLPLSTVHYNVQQLLQGKLVEAEEFHYSPKGKEVNHYRLANKYIIIAPAATFGFRQRLRSVIPALILALASTAAIRLLTKPETAAAPLLAQAESAALRMAPAVQSEPNVAWWFLFGSVVFVLGYILFAALDYLWHKEQI